MLLASISDRRTVVILLGAYNGGKHIADQLDSIKAQTHQNWRLIVSDDRSTDNTLDIVKAYQHAWGAEKLEIRQGPQQGFVRNFLSMACDPTIKADYFAFSDQDDVWLPEKLQVAIDYLDTVEHPAIPHVYGCRTIYTHENLKPYGMSPEFVFPRTFRNALIQNVVGGNTMVFNPVAKELLEAVGLVPTPSHDWWLYQLVTGAGGYVYYDPKPQVFYRQHNESLVGGNSSITAKVRRMMMLFKGRFKSWSDQNIHCLNLARPQLTEGSREILDLFAKMRGAHFKDRLRLLEVCGLYRQTLGGTLSLLAASLFNKI